MFLYFFQDILHNFWVFPTVWSINQIRFQFSVAGYRKSLGDFSGTRYKINKMGACKIRFLWSNLSWFKFIKLAKSLVWPWRRPSAWIYFSCQFDLKFIIHHDSLHYCIARKLLDFFLDHFLLCNLAALKWLFLISEALIFAICVDILFIDSKQ